MPRQPWQRPWRPPRLKRASLPYYFLSDYALWRRPKNSPLLIHTTYFTCFGRSVGPNGTFGRLKAGYKELLLPGELGPVHHCCAVAAAAAATQPLPMAAATIIRQVGSGAGWASRVKGSPLGSTVIPSLPLLLWAIHYYYCVARGEGPFSKLTEPWGGRNNPLLPCMSDAASAKRHLATLLSCTIEYILITAKAAI